MRRGPRTGAVQVPTSVVDRIMRAIMKRAVKTPKGMLLHFEPMDVPRVLAEELAKAGRAVPSRPRKLGTFTIPHYDTGRTSSVPIYIEPDRNSPRSLGRTSVSIGAERYVPKRERRERVQIALAKLKRAATPEEIERLGDQIFEWHAGREIHISVPQRPLLPHEVEKLRSTLAHELVHIADPQARMQQTREAKKSDALTDVEMIAEELGLSYVPTKREDVRVAPSHGRAWANEPTEVTAMIAEIMEEVGQFRRSMAIYRLYKMEHHRTRRPRNRADELIQFLKFTSPTYAEVHKSWTPENHSRVLRAIWDRYHNEPSFPAARGVLINRRRTSRRRTSRC